MSSEQDQIRALAERIARRLSDAEGQDGAARENFSAGEESGELTSLRAKLSEMQRRLAHVEAHLTEGESCAHETRLVASPNQDYLSTPAREHRASGVTVTRSPWLSGTYVPATAHPSDERFAGITEDVSELVDYFEREKTCNVEPGSRPCDHCGMCSSRGF